jgi:hypothetical protein
MFLSQRIINYFYYSNYTTETLGTLHHVFISSQIINRDRSERVSDLEEDRQGGRALEPTGRLPQRGLSGVGCNKAFFVRHGCLFKKARAFFLGSVFQTSLLLARKARAYPRRENPIVSHSEYPHDLARKYSYQFVKGTRQLI